MAYLQIEVQKLLKQNEYFERSNNEMEAELKDSIQDADTSERDARYVRKQNIYETKLYLCITLILHKTDLIIENKLQG